MCRTLSTDGVPTITAYFPRSWWTAYGQLVHGILSSPPPPRSAPLYPAGSLFQEPDVSCHIEGEAHLKYVLGALRVSHVVGGGQRQGGRGQSHRLLKALGQEPGTGIWRIDR